MSKLEHTKIYRGGVTAPNLTLETSQCSFDTNISKRALDFRFRLASKGGGTTDVLLRIGLNDLPLILKDIAGAMPEIVIGTLSDCAALANKKILEQLTEARRVQSDEKARASSLVEKLEVVQEFVFQKYLEAPVGEDEKAEAVKSQLDLVIDSLRSLERLECPTIAPASVAAAFAQDPQGKTRNCSSVMTRAKAGLHTCLFY